jgi:hypothetical protein
MPSDSVEQCLSATKVNLQLYAEDLERLDDPSHSDYILVAAKQSIEHAIIAHRKRYNITQK